VSNPREAAPFVPSVIDRLLGEETPTERDLDYRRATHVGRLKALLQRDLENLLNTRCRCGSYPREYTELEHSLANYGIPDFTGAEVGSQGGRAELLHVIRASVERFEPRLRRVSVTALDDSRDPIDRVLRFRIEAELWTGEEPLSVAFLSTMEPASGKFRIDEGT
jgi:type VI secretion system protein ImpF